MRFAFSSALVATSLSMACPAGATSAEEPPSDVPPDAPFPRLRAGIGLGAGYDFGVPAAHGPGPYLSFRIGKRLGPSFSVYYQGSPFVFWDRRSANVSGGVQSSALFAWMLADRVELAVGPAFDTSLFDTETGDTVGFTPVLGLGGHARAAVALYRTHAADRSRMGLFLAAEIHAVVPVLPPAPRALGFASGSIGWEWY
ncbi:Hypothetical protein A7982_03027 [Minicystis rosea]|nr:Hypothetical protein A7982_03027 [Minicystis rosea]